jgi:hypothetical protein
VDDSSAEYVFDGLHVGKVAVDDLTGSNTDVPFFSVTFGHRHGAFLERVLAIVFDHGELRAFIQLSLFESEVVSANPSTISDGPPRAIFDSAGFGVDLTLRTIFVGDEDLVPDVCHFRCAELTHNAGPNDGAMVIRPFEFLVRIEYLLGFHDKRCTPGV